MPKKLIAISVLLLALGAIFGILNAHKTADLRSATARSEIARQQAERLRSAKEKEMKARGASVTAANTKPTETETKVADAEAELVKSQTEKSDLQSRLTASEAQIADLQKRIGPAASNVVSGAQPPAGPTDVQTQLRETRLELDSAEREKALLSDKIRTAQEHSIQLEQEKKRRVPGSGNPGLRGTILAVNQAYNFVVLNLGGRQGVEANSEMLVLRGGALIGKIRVSSVEPSTAIADIVSTSLARGVQVQPGDIVIYAGSSS
ncbi:MAG TPA: hypothetical protein VGQ82_09220 [Chthoniobacterales bacterium]|nr:hypothetical protein [Chthoniobacterales bacterium]